MPSHSIAHLTGADVLRAYSGIPGCMCGCRGTYWCNPQHVAEAARHRGYPIEADEISEQQVLRILRRVQRFSTAELERDGRIVWAEGKTRVYALYLTDSAALREARRLRSFQITRVRSS